MIRKEVKIVKDKEMNGRLGASFIKKASKYKSQIFIIKGRSKMSAKSLLGFFSLRISEGDIIEIEVCGEDEEEAIDELIKHITEVE